MPKVFIYDTDRHVYTWPESGFDNDVIRDTASKWANGKLGSGEPQSSTVHHHKRDQACVGYHHDSFYPEGAVVFEDAAKVQSQIMEEMRNTVPTE